MENKHKHPKPTLKYLLRRQEIHLNVFKYLKVYSITGANFRFSNFRDRFGGILILKLPKNTIGRILVKRNVQTLN